MERPEGPKNDEPNRFLNFLMKKLDKDDHHEKSAQKSIRILFPVMLMKKLLFISLLITVALSGCVSIGAIPDTGNEAIRGSYHQIAPIIDMEGSMDETGNSQNIIISIPLHTF